MQNFIYDFLFSNFYAKKNFDLYFLYKYPMNKYFV